MQLVAMRAADGVETRVPVESDRIDDERVAIPLGDRVAEPRRIDLLGMLVPERDDVEPGADLEEERDVLVVLENLHRVGRVHRSHQPVRHAHAGIVAVPDRVVVLHVVEAGRREGQFLRSLLQRRVPVGRRHVRHVLVIPDATEVRLAVRQPRRRTGRGRPVTPRRDARAAGGRLRGGRGNPLDQDGGKRCDDENRA